MKIKLSKKIEIFYKSEKKKTEKQQDEIKNGETYFKKLLRNLITHPKFEQPFGRLIRRHRTIEIKVGQYPILRTTPLLIYPKRPKIPWHTVG